MSKQSGDKKNIITKIGEIITGEGLIFVERKEPEEPEKKANK